MTLTALAALISRSQKDANRCSLKAEAFSQAVLEEPNVRGLDRLGVAAEDDHDRRSHCDLGGVEELVGLPSRALAGH